MRSLSLGHSSSATNPSIVWWWFLYVVFVLYGSLVPLDYRPIPLEKAWALFQQIHLLDVGAGGRADWVANGVLYVPVGFLTAILLAGRRRVHFPGMALAGAVAFGALLAVGVEFAQLAFPPRTVSLNDVLAELIGTGLGVGLAAVAGRRFRALLAAMVGRADRLVPRLVKAYALGYCAFSLFPYDFLLSAGELADKFHSDSWGWLWAGGGGRGGVAAGVAKLLAEVLAALPLGWLLARWGRSPRQACGVGVLLGAIIEIAQFCLVSGVAQGFSVLTRAVGVGVGALTWRRRAGLDPLRLAEIIRRFGLPLMALYLLALMAVTGWFELPWQGLEGATGALDQVRFLPFYYHYYTTEQAALLSLTSVALMYAPLGVAAWTMFLGPGAAAGAAGVAAVGIETSKLFLVGLHPDPTNVLLAGFSAWWACRLARGAERLATANRLGVAVGQGTPEPGEPFVGNFPAEGLPSAHEIARSRLSGPERGAGLVLRQPKGLNFGVLLIAIVLASWGVASFPLQPVLLGLGLIGYGVLLWFRPQVMWVVVPAALALLDLAPWSGRFYVDEFDFLLLVSSAVAYARVPPVEVRRDPVLHIVLALVGLTYGIAVLRGLWPLQMPDDNAFSNYYSPFNALRVGKGVAWAFLLYGLLGRFAAAGVDVGRLFGRGMVVGLAGTVAVVIWERAAFPGLFNFSDIYRVTGPFSQMHTGGADLECYLTAAVPFLVWVLFERRSWMERALGLLLLGASTYAVMVAFSRAGYAGYGLAVIVTAGFALMRRDGAGVASASTLKRSFSVVVVLAVILGIATPVFIGGFAQERLARIGGDFQIRMNHWRDALAMRDPGWMTELFGMGLGRFPETHYWRSTEVRAAAYRLGLEGQQRFLRLGSGSPLYIEQFVAVQAHESYALNLSARSHQGAGRLTVSICEKWLLTSARCVFQTLEVPEGAEWQVLRTTIPTGEVGGTPWYLPRPVKLAINNANPRGVVDVDQIALMARDGTNLLANGDFSEGLDRWFFSADVDLPWHVWSLPIAVLFEMGWVGVMAQGLVFALGLLRRAQQPRSGERVLAATLAASIGIVLLGPVDSLVDSPRILLLLLLVFSLASWPCHHRAGPMHS